MILVITGTQKFQFDRLLRAVDDLIDRGVIQEEVFAQTGSSHYVPQNFKGQAYLSKEDLLSYMKQSDIIITHGGTASILDAVRMEKKVIPCMSVKLSFLTFLPGLHSIWNIFICLSGMFR